MQACGELLAVCVDRRFLRGKHSPGLHCINQLVLMDNPAAVVAGGTPIFGVDLRLAFS